MLKMRTRPTTLPPAMVSGGDGGGGGNEWEMRPGGMLVQKRSPDSDRVGAPPPPMIRVRIKYGSVYHEINISPQATFGELKKRLSGPTGVHHQDQKILYKDKERDSKAFLDVAGVKDKSKMVLVEDPVSQEKRLLEMRKKAKTERASKTVSDISLEVDRLAGRVSALETVISKGGRVSEKDLVNLIELLMNELLKLDGIVADGDVKLQRKMQVTRVQRCVETVDVLKIKNSMQQQQRQSNGQRLAPIQEHSREAETATIQEPIESLIDMPIHHNSSSKKQEIQEQEACHGQQQQGNSGSGRGLVTAEWETFEAAAPQTLSSSANNLSTTPRFNWEFFD